jgi:chromosome segregation ATPase
MYLIILLQQITKKLEVLQEEVKSAKEEATKAKKDCDTSQKHVEELKTELTRLKEVLMNHLFASLLCVNTFSHEYFTGEFHPAPPS